MYFEDKKCFFQFSKLNHAIALTLIKTFNKKYFIRATTQILTKKNFIFQIIQRIGKDLWVT